MCFLNPFKIHTRHFITVFLLQDQDKEYVGFATLPNQVHRKTVKKGFTFTLIVAGESLMSANWDSSILIRATSGIRVIESLSFPMQESLALVNPH